MAEDFVVSRHDHARVPKDCQPRCGVCSKYFRAEGASEAKAHAAADAAADQVPIAAAGNAAADAASDEVPKAFAAAGNAADDAAADEVPKASAAVGNAAADSATEVDSRVPPPRCCGCCCGNCQAGAACSNTAGTFVSACNVGYSGKGVTNTDDDDTA